MDESQLPLKGVISNGNSEHCEFECKAKVVAVNTCTQQLTYLKKIGRFILRETNVVNTKNNWNHNLEIFNYETFRLKKNSYNE